MSLVAVNLCSSSGHQDATLMHFIQSKALRIRVRSSSATLLQSSCRRPLALVAGSFVALLTDSGPSCQYSWCLAYRKLTHFFFGGCRWEVMPILGPSELVAIGIQKMGSPSTPADTLDRSRSRHSGCNSFAIARRHYAVASRVVSAVMTAAVAIRAHLNP